ncbi:MAG TPA: SpoIID/LytB domain-containing protein, partial [Gemmatimonadales bacterium]|nr:SpoIID/LytB domain-containing protein [Gemmatimonadales bacterium]
MNARRHALVMALAVSAACGQREPPEAPRPTPTVPPAGPARPEPRPPAEVARQVGAPFSAGPAIRIGLAVDVPRVTVGGGTAQVIRAADGRNVVLVAAGRPATLTVSGGLIAVDDGARLRTLRPPLTVEAGSADGFVRTGGGDYRGTLEVRRGAGGLTVIDRLSLESYLGGVVAAELGVNDPDAAEALAAQAVIARTYAVRQQRRYDRKGFD